MTKNEFAAAVKARMLAIGTDNGGMVLTQAQCVNILDVIFDAEHGVIARELYAGGEVAIHGFGSLRVHTLEERPARNPSTGENFIAPAKRVVRFKCGSVLRAKVASKPPKVAAPAA